MKTEYEVLLALKPYLNKSDGEELEQMVKNEEPVDNINRWVNTALTKRQIHTAKLLESEEAAMEFKDYYHKLNDDEKLWVKKFYYEMYGNAIYNIPEDYRLLKTEEMIKESNRMRNLKKSEMFDSCYREENPHVLDRETVKHYDDIENIDWEQVYSLFGYEPALNYIIDEAIEELKIKNFDKRLSLVRFFIKMNRLRLAENKDKRNPKKKVK